MTLKQATYNSSLPTAWLGLRILFCVPWAGSLALIGLWLAANVARRAELSAMGQFDAIVGGVGLVCLGQFVFATLVADRIFPRADKRIAGMCQVLMAMGVVGACGYGLIRVALVLASA